MRAGLGLQPSWWGWNPGLRCCAARHMASVILSIVMRIPVGHSWAGPFRMLGVEATGVKRRRPGRRGQCGAVVALVLMERAHPGGHSRGQLCFPFSRSQQVHTVDWGRLRETSPASHPPEPRLCRTLQVAQTPHLLSSFCIPNALPASGKTCPTAVISPLHR